MIGLRKPTLFIILIIAFIAISAVSFAVLVDKDISDDQAVEAIIKFSKAKKEDVKFIEKNDKLNKIEIFLNDGRTFSVDSKSGKVLNAFGNKIEESRVDSSELPLNRENAIKAAADYARSKHDNFEELTLLNVSNFRGGAYYITWQKVDENNAQRPEKVTVKIDTKSGEIYGYFSKDTETSIETKSKITKDEAIEIVKKKMESREAGEIKSTTLIVEKDKNNQERLCWAISYIDRDPEGPGTAWGTGAYIDAITGEDITEDFNM